MIDQYKEVRECKYKGEHYSVRDNGAVMRHLREGKKARKDDGVWTFGKKNEKNGYMFIGEHRVHSIVATAFYGERNTNEFVVDHKDTNRCNNRLENLEWVTKLENILGNPITRRKIILRCGSVEKFLENPSMLKDGDVSQNLSWMRTVTNAEAQVSRAKLLAWAESDKLPTGSFGEGIYRADRNYDRNYYNVDDFDDEPLIINAKSPNNALQKNWRVPVNFECCPTELGEDPIKDYFNRLEIGAVYDSVHYRFNTEPTFHKVFDRALVEDGNAIVVISYDENGTKPYALSKISYADGFFTHENKGSYFEEDGARKYFTIAQGLEWTGGEVFDDMC